MEIFYNTINFDFSGFPLVDSLPQETTNLSERLPKQTSIVSCCMVQTRSTLVESSFNHIIAGCCSSVYNLFRIGFPSSNGTLAVEIALHSFL